MSETNKSMQWVSALSTEASLENAVKDVAAQVNGQLQQAPDFGLVFISAAYASEFVRLLPLLHEALSIPCLIGCSGGGIIGTPPASSLAKEEEQRPGLSLCVGVLPGVTVQPFTLQEDDLPDLDSPPAAWTERIGVRAADNPSFILLADPFSARITELLQGLDFAFPTAVKIGGLAGISGFDRSSGLFFNDVMQTEGVVGVALTGNIVLDAIVAQGCRPIGRPLRIAASERNILLEVEECDDFGGETQTPLAALQEILRELDEGDRALAQDSLHVGIAQDGFKEKLQPGDFLIRNLLGVDPRIGALAIGDRLRLGQRIQFHLRDARTSADDLETLLIRYRSEHKSLASAPIGALMFACMGRGEGLYQKPNFDSHLFQEFVGNAPVTGFFCGGEIGPVGGTTFLHGYTSVFGICRSAQP
ncbi:MAG: FIST N-terminal domain-containing protein [Cyanobacteria bacterium P01_C01_bin.120]